MKDNPLFMKIGLAIVMIMSCFRLGAQDNPYTSFGYSSVVNYSLLEVRTEGSNYRFGFNGKENDREWGTGCLTQDYGFRLYNPALGKFLSVDPLAPSYPELTTYQFASNTPIQAIDLDGLEANVVTHTYAETKSTAVRTATQLGVQAQRVRSGNELMNVLKKATTDKGRISSFVNWGHSWSYGLFVEGKVKKGIYTDEYYNYDDNDSKISAGDGVSLGDLLFETSIGNIQTAKHSLFIFASCGACGYDRSYKKDAIGWYSDDSFAAKFSDYIDKEGDTSLPQNGAFTYDYKITAIAATGLSNLKNKDSKESFAKTDAFTTKAYSGWIKTEKVYRIKKQYVLQGIEMDIRGNPTLKYGWQTSTRLIQTKKTNMGKVINPAKIINKHNPNDATIK